MILVINQKPIIATLLIAIFVTVFISLHMNQRKNLWQSKNATSIIKTMSVHCTTKKWLKAIQSINLTYSLAK